MTELGQETAYLSDASAFSALHPINFIRMRSTNPTLLHALTPALKAIGELFEDGFAKLTSRGETEALAAHAEIEQRPIGQRTSSFFRHFLPLRKEMVVLLADSYHRYFKLALAHGSRIGGDPDQWAQEQLRPAVRAVLDWILDWYILACDGENQDVRHLGSMEFVPGQTVSLSIPTTVPEFPPPSSWRAPVWLFEISLAYFGFGPLKEQHVPVRDSDEKLGEAHTRLLLKAMSNVARINNRRKEHCHCKELYPFSAGLQLKTIVVV